MTQSPLEPLILRLAVPAIVSNLVTVTYNMADTWFIGRLGNLAVRRRRRGLLGDDHHAGHRVLLRPGRRQLAVPRAWQTQRGTCSRLLSVAFFGSVGFGVLLGVLGLLVLHPLVHALGATDTIAPYAVQYLTPLLVATPCVTGSFTMNGLLRFQGLSPIR